MASGSGPSGSGASSYVHCPYHPDEPLIEDHSAGDMICPKCGLVVGDRLALFSALNPFPLDRHS